MVKKTQQSEKEAHHDAVDKTDKAIEISKKNESDMKSTAAIWAGPGAPPPITAGDTATMAAPRPGFDPSLNPGGPGAIESTHTTNVASEHSKPTKPHELDGKATAKALAQSAKEEAAPAEPSPKQEAAAKAAQPLVTKPHVSEKDAKTDADEKAAKAVDIAEKNEKDMRSNAAIWAGHGAPPQITAGDTATMSAPRPGFDPSLNPGGGAVESNHTNRVAAREAKLSKNE